MNKKFEHKYQDSQELERKIVAMRGVRFWEGYSEISRSM